MVKLVELAHPFSVAVAVTVPVTAAVVVLVPVKDAILPVPLAASPMEVVLFVQVYAAVGEEPVRLIADTEVL